MALSFGVSRLVESLFERIMGQETRIVSIRNECLQGEHYTKCGFMSPADNNMVKVKTWWVLQCPASPTWTVSKNSWSYNILVVLRSFFFLEVWGICGEDEKGYFLPFLDISLCFSPMSSCGCNPSNNSLTEYLLYNRTFSSGPGQQQLTSSWPSAQTGQGGIFLTVVSALGQLLVHQFVLEYSLHGQLDPSSAGVKVGPFFANRLYLDGGFPISIPHSFHL